jgi:hypothetical protein
VVEVIRMPVLADRRASLSPTAERDLRKQIDLSVSRALVDGVFAQRLLTDPTMAIEDFGCPPQQFKSLRSIHAIDLVDFARQAQALFWRLEPKSPYLEEQLPLAAAAAR